MDNLLRKIESDEVVVYTDQVYSIDIDSIVYSIKYKKRSEEKKNEKNKTVGAGRYSDIEKDD